MRFLYIAEARQLGRVHHVPLNARRESLNVSWMKVAGVAISSYARVIAYTVRLVELRLVEE